MANLTSGFYLIKPLKIEERPLLNFPEAAWLASLAASIFVFGILVQVTWIVTTYFNNVPRC